MKDTVTRGVTMAEARLELEKAKDAELKKTRLPFFLKIFSPGKNFILEKQKKMKDTLIRGRLIMAETRLELEKAKDAELEKTRLELEKAKDAELEKIRLELEKAKHEELKKIRLELE
jgi:prolyl oligopeptidase PreP (S9A serine peptidase family)